MLTYNSCIKRRCPLALWVLPDAVQQQEDASVGDVVKNIIAVAPCQEQSLVLEDTELLADKRLTGTSGFGDLCHSAGLPLPAQEIQDTEAHRMGCVTNNWGDSFQCLHINQVVMLLFVYYHNIVIPIRLMICLRNRNIF